MGAVCRMGVIQSGVDRRNGRIFDLLNKGCLHIISKQVKAFDIMLGKGGCPWKPWYNTRGRYKSEVIACRESGVWEGAELDGRRWIRQDNSFQVGEQICKRDEREGNI
jgi:hypothetical protein